MESQAALEKMNRDYPFVRCLSLNIRPYLTVFYPVVRCFICIFVRIFYLFFQICQDL